MKVLITCEHGGNKIPKEYLQLFNSGREILETHRGYDLGALELAKAISKKAGDYFYYSEISRLLVELNRSIYNPGLFSELSKDLTLNEKNKILKKYYFPYRNKIEDLIRDLIFKEDKVLHMSVHTFTPVFRNKERNADIGILYDPKRKKEKGFAFIFKEELLFVDKNLRIRFNYPYLGISDGFTSYLRKKFNQKNYAGIELEVNQKFLFRQELNGKEVRNTISSALLNEVHLQGEPNI